LKVHPVFQGVTIYAEVHLVKPVAHRPMMKAGRRLIIDMKRVFLISFSGLVIFSRTFNRYHG